MIFNLVGNPLTGFSLIGPFPNRQDAAEWQEGCDESCWIIESEVDVGGPNLAEIARAAITVCGSRDFDAGVRAAGYMEPGEFFADLQALQSHLDA
jgi:hypothetical protein